MKGQTDSTTPIVRIAEIEVYPKYREAFLEIAQEVAHQSLKQEPGVLCLYPVREIDKPNTYRVIEVYRDRHAYEAHIRTPHFLTYKEKSLPMVASLRLIDTEQIVPGLLGSIFSKHQATGGKLTKLITLEEHFIIPSINKQVSDYLTAQNGGKPIATPAQQELLQIILPDSDIADLGEKRLRFMDEAGVTMQVLSYGAGGPQNIQDSALALRLCREANDSLSRAIAQHPDRYAGFALLPMADAKLATTELERCVRELGFKGAMISGSPFGKHLDDESFRPVFAKATELGVPIYLHPGAVVPSVSEHYTQNGKWSDVASAMFATAGFLWHADSDIEIIRLIMSGLFEDFPSLQIISGHWGELVPFYLNRLDDQQSKVLKLPKKISEYFRSNIYLTPSGFFTEAQLKYAIDVVGADRILYLADYPFLKDTRTRLFLEEAGISDKDRKRIAYENAEALLNL